MHQMWENLHKDVFNFYETRVMTGIAAKSNLVTNTDRIGRAAVVQPVGRERVITTKCVSASSWCLSLFVILSGKLHDAI